MEGNRIWQAKLAAWTHDPAEKALVLLRDPAGHEGRTVERLRKTLFAGGFPADLLDIVKQADHWAAAADRPQFPRDADDRYAAWTQVRFTEQPVLIHPLSGRQYSLLKLPDVEVKDVAAVSLNHFETLVVRNGGGIDYRKTFLSFWRMGPASPHGSLGVLWGVLPADTRVPDHAIWDHLQLTSALAGAMAGDPSGRVALVAVSLGPVQSFIAQGRSTSDLWAGSHLLSRLAWEALRVVCERFGPDSVIFPHLHGVPLVDLWLRAEGIEVDSADLDEPTDANPAFVASLPNRFVAVVPESEVENLARSIEDGVRAWVRERAEKMIDKLLERGEPPDEAAAKQILLTQVRRQLAGFPEVHWAAVPWSLAGVGEKAQPNDLRRITSALVKGTPEGALLDTEPWKVLSGDIEIEGARFYRPNPGVLYPDLYVLLDRLLAAAKATRTFDGTIERGYRCSLCGEREWLTDDTAALIKPRGQRKNTLWTRLAAKNPSWSRKEEHLCALCGLKRLWPALFAEELRPLLKERKDSSEDSVRELQRYVVSTHTMALAPTLERMIKALDEGGLQETVSDEGRRRGCEERTPRQWLEVIQHEIKNRKVDEFVALPKRLADELTRRREANREVADAIRAIPALLDRLAEEEDEEGRTQQRVRHAIECIAGVPPERYYALVLLDGDRMGAWLTAGDPEARLTFLESWHPAVAAEVKKRSSHVLDRYISAMRPPSPARHVFISRALNGFAIHLARLIVEEHYNGKLLYAGGDDLLAMVAVDDLLKVLMALRCVYSGIAPGDDVELKDPLGRPRFRPEVRRGRDHVLLGGESRRQLLRMMGCRATLSAGAVIAHYSAPLGAVLRELRAAERRAKARDGGGRDAFSVTLMKRAGGISQFTSKWFFKDARAAGSGSPADHRGDRDLELQRTSIGLLLELRDAFAKHLSRRAAYHVLEWLQRAGADAPVEQIEALLAYQFARQARKESLEQRQFDPKALASRVVEVAAAACPKPDSLGENAPAGHSESARPAPRKTPATFIEEALILAEFLAREGRAESGAGG
jgi:CRISPR-associated protein Cmr2